MPDEDDFDVFDEWMHSGRSIPAEPLNGAGGAQESWGRWRFVPCLDSWGHDLINVGTGLDAGQLQREVLKRRGEGAVAVNTKGWIKFGLDAEETWRRFTDDESQGLWILLEPPEQEALSDDLCGQLLQQDSLLSTAAPYEGASSVLPPTNSVMSHRSAKSDILESKGRWVQQTADKLQHARSLTKQAVKSIVESDAVHGQAQKYNSHTNVVHQTIRKKIGRTEDMCKALEDRSESVEDTIRQVGECLFQLQRAHRCKWAPLNVCERRLELREGRPPQELVHDHCQEALEGERSALVAARAALQEQSERMKETLVGLDKLNGELREDLQHKRHAMRIDRSCLSPRKPPGPVSSARGGGGGGGGGRSERLVLPALQDMAYYGLPPSPKCAEPGTGLHQEEVRQESTQRLVTRAVKAEEDAMRLANESDALIMSARRECARASQQAQLELARRVDETQTLKRQLEAQMLETDETIAQTELSLHKTRQTLDSHDRPLRALDKQFAMRGKRTEREGIRDLVHDEMEGHFDSLKKSVKSLTTKFQTTKEILEQLRSSKQQMQEDYRNKLQAQKIDDACIKVTARKAMELDRSDPRGGRCRESSRRKQHLVFPDLDAGGVSVADCFC